MSGVNPLAARRLRSVMTEGMLAGRAADTEFIAFDVETTGLIPGVDRIVEIGAIRFRDGEVLDRFQQLVDPHMPIPAEAQAVNGISDEMVAGMPCIEGVLPRFFSFVDRACPVAHNAAFDAGFIAADRQRLGLAGPSLSVLDTRGLAIRLLPGLGSYSLKALSSRFRLPVSARHRALDDAEACMALFCSLAGRLGTYPSTTLAQLLQIQGTLIDFGPHAPAMAFHAPALKRALEEGRSVEIVYLDAGGAVSTRTITPLAFNVANGTVSIDAFCHLRQAKRSFRLDRIRRIQG